MSSWMVQAASGSDGAAVNVHDGCQPTASTRTDRADRAIATNRRHAGLTGLRRPAAAWLSACFLAVSGAIACAQDKESGPVDTAVRAALLQEPDGEIARVKTKYNDIEIAKWQDELVMSFHVKGSSHIETIVNLRDPDDLPLHYTRTMTAALVYPAEPRRVLMVGLGGGSISTYLARAMPDLKIDAVDIDPGVIDVAKRYFGLRQSDQVRFFVNDGRVFVRRASERYDIVLMDAFFGAAVPFHLLTREFYALLRERLTPTGVAVFNVHEGTRFYLSTLKTLASVFSDIHLYPSGRGEMIVVASPQPMPEASALKERAQALQKKHDFRYPLDDLVKRRAKTPNFANAVLLTDDFAPMDLQGMVDGPAKNRQ